MVKLCGCILPCWPVLNESLSHKLLVLAQNFYIPLQSRQITLLLERKCKSYII